MSEENASVRDDMAGQDLGQAVRGLRGSQQGGDLVLRQRREGVVDKAAEETVKGPAPASVSRRPAACTAETSVV